MIVVLGPAIIRADTRLTDGCTGDLTVASGCTLELYGTLSGNLLVCGGATAMISGEVQGVIYSEGGCVQGQVRRVRRSTRARYI